MQDANETKKKIISLIQSRGPSLPIHIAKQINYSMLFASAFLSELISEQKIRISHLRVGSSPIYFIPGQESQLEKFSEHLKSREKEAFNLLKEKKFLEDSIQHPAIRVALRSIKDYAIAFKNDNKIYWRYFKKPTSEFQTPEKIEKKETIDQKPEKEISSQTQIRTKNTNEEKIKTPEEKPLNIFEEKQKKESKPKKKTTQKTTIIRQKTQDKFFNKIKEFLAQKNMEIIGIEGFSKNDLTLKIKTSTEEKLLIAYNKKRITEIDFTNANKKASEVNLSYIICSLGEPTKKLNNFIKSIKNMSSMEKIQ